MTMNELINELIKKYGSDMGESIGKIFNEDNFRQAIQTACKAQRNACLRIYESNWERQYMTELIKNAEITKEDYK